MAKGRITHYINVVNFRKGGVLWEGSVCGKYIRKKPAFCGVSLGLHFNSSSLLHSSEHDVKTGPATQGLWTVKLESLFFKEQKKWRDVFNTV